MSSPPAVAAILAVCSCVDIFEVTFYEAVCKRVEQESRSGLHMFIIVSGQSE